MASKALSLVACANSAESLCILAWGSGLKLLLLAPSLLGQAGDEELLWVQQTYGVLPWYEPYCRKQDLIIVRKSKKSPKSSKDGLHYSTQTKRESK